MLLVWTFVQLVGQVMLRATVVAARWGCSASGLVLTPLPCLPHFVSTTNWRDAVVAPFGPCQHQAWGYTSSLCKGLGLLGA